MRRWDQLSLAYTEPEGLPELREEVAKLYNGVSAKDVLIMGPQEALSIAMLAMLRPGDHVVVTFPGYQSLYQIAHTIGAEVSFWHMRADEEGRLVFQVSSLLMASPLTILAFGSISLGRFQRDNGCMLDPCPSDQFG